MASDEELELAFDEDAGHNSPNSGDKSEPELLPSIIPQPWQPLECEVQCSYKPNAKSKSYFFFVNSSKKIKNNFLSKKIKKKNKENDIQVFQMKSTFGDNHYALIITDLINVWYSQCNCNDITSLHEQYNSHVKIGGVSQINQHLSNMVCFSDQIGKDHTKLIVFKHSDHTEMLFNLLCFFFTIFFLCFVKYRFVLPKGQREIRKIATKKASLPKHTNNTQFNSKGD